MRELKELMSRASSVNEWNDLREEAKKQFEIAFISELDASGYIVEILNKTK